MTHTPFVRTALPDMLTVPEVCHKLRCKPGTVRQYIKTGKLKGVKLPPAYGWTMDKRHWRYRIRADSVAKLMGVAVVEPDRMAARKTKQYWDEQAVAQARLKGTKPPATT